MDTTARRGLTKDDRCDKCGAEAFIKAIFAIGDLLFCAHHGRAFNTALAEQSLLIQDHTADINVKPSVAAF